MAKSTKLLKVLGNEHDAVAASDDMSIRLWDIGSPAKERKGSMYVFLVDTKTQVLIRD